MKSILEENARRKRKLREDYDPLTGRGCYGQRREVHEPRSDGRMARVPETMVLDADYGHALDPHS